MKIDQDEKTGDWVATVVVDVVVTDGFVGNVMLKTTEGLASMLSDFIKQEFMRGPLSKLAAVIVKAKAALD